MRVGLVFYKNQSAAEVGFPSHLEKTTDEKENQLADLDYQPVRDQIFCFKNTPDLAGIDLGNPWLLDIRLWAVYAVGSRQVTRGTETCWVTDIALIPTS